MGLVRRLVREQMRRPEWAHEFTVWVKDDVVSAWRMGCVLQNNMVLECSGE